MAGPRRIPAEDLNAFVVGLVEKLGTPADIAQVVATTLVNADLAGHTSHGVMQISNYLGGIERGWLVPDARPTIARELAGSAVIDAHSGWGHYTAKWTMDRLIEKARAAGVACASIGGVQHIGRLGEYAEQAAAAGCVGIISVAWGGRDVGPAPPYGGVSKTLGTNPFTVGAPTGDDTPFISDFATTAVAHGKIAVARLNGTEAPADTIVDKDGAATVDPAEFFDGGALRIFGGHKGYALSLVTCVLAQLNGEYDEEGRRVHGVYMQAIDIGAFQPLDTYQRHVRSLMGDMKASETAPGFEEVLAPGEPERRARDRQLAEGVELSAGMVEHLRECASRAGVDAPC
ncbi:Ldh family oxidoreductase [Candidatus Poribacteria bacterium]|nr:Ldh family oxidoreductase [Candidatus Poribacteria bacterium]MBT5714523.1 Ldh family oxidoreductase [Candidatus Poribacteria bacterium]MBT7101616.1 Ldh family oxidoreductase [Candidatus Poribacteria bacterium]MBT7807265.1 Ldh family oxidoreductase [Candidatus Poribacteria bacterium]